jgi:hypothetical protein
VQEAIACGLPVLVGNETGLEEFRMCAGLHFCELNPESIRRSLLRILGLDGCSKPIETRTTSLLDLLPTEEQWIEQLYGWLEPGVSHNLKLSEAVSRRPNELQSSPRNAEKPKTPSRGRELVLTHSMKVTSFLCDAQRTLRLSSE